MAVPLARVRVEKISLNTVISFNRTSRNELGYLPWICPRKWTNAGTEGEVENPRPVRIKSV